MRASRIRNRAASATWVVAALAVVTASATPETPSPEAAYPEAASPEVASLAAGALAPAGCWTTTGGCPARTGSALTEPLGRDPETAWDVALGGTIESEPLVWGPRVLVSIHAGGDRRLLRTLDLATGRDLMPPFRVTSPVPLAPSLWGRLVAIRSGASRVSALRWGYERLSEVDAWNLSGPASAPVVHRDEIYAVAGDGLVRLRLGRDRPLWKAHGRFRGPPSLRGPDVYALEVDRDERAYVQLLARSDGSRGARAFLGRPGERLRKGTDISSIAVHARGVFVRAGAPFVAPGAGRLPCVAFPLPLPEGSSVPLLPGATALRAAPVEVGGGWLGYLEDEETGRVLALSPDVLGNEIRVLAEGDTHPEFTGLEPLSRARSVAHVGARAFDLETGRILWDAEGASRFPAVPAHGRLLLVRGASRLVALRSWRDDGGESLACAPEGTAVAGARIVLADGSIARADVRLEDRWPVGARDGTPFVDAVLVEDGDGALVWGAGPEGLQRGLDLLLDAELAAAYASLAVEARPSNDPELVSRLVGAAALHGAEERELARLRERVSALLARPEPVDEALVAAVLAREEELGRRGVELAWQRAEHLNPIAPLTARVILLRAVLSREPDHAGAVEAVRALLPAELASYVARTAGPGPAGGASSALEWLEFARLTERCPIELVTPPEGRRRTSLEQRGLVRARRGWREDLVGFQSENLLVVTPFTRPGAIARALSMGELVCEALASIFAGRGEAREARRPLVLHLYESQAAYLAASGGSGEDAGLAWTAGHYDVDADVSRIFLPEGDEAFDAVMQTYAHELAHHWLRKRCPAYKPAAVRLRSSAPGYWIVEGFACLVESFRFDLERRTWETFDPRSKRLDLLANAGDGALWPWPELFEASHDLLARARFEGHVAVPSSWYLGRRTKMDGRHAFYAQAGAASQYLFHAEDGRYREALLDYLVSFYTGRTRELDFTERFGLAPQDLGERVRAFAVEAPAAGR